MTEENRIIRRIINGEIDLFRALVERYQKPILRLINNLINNQHACEDIGQEVFLAAYKNLSSFDPACSSFSTWLFTIARNKSLNAMKKKNVLTLADLPENHDPQTPSNDLELNDFFLELDRQLITLPARQRVAFTLAEVEGLPYEEIAQIEGARLGTIKSRINRAKKKLRRALKDFGGDNA